MNFSNSPGESYMYLLVLHVLHYFDLMMFYSTIAILKVKLNKKNNLPALKYTSPKGVHQFHSDFIGHIQRYCHLYLQGERNCNSPGYEKV